MFIDFDHSSVVASETKGGDLVSKLYSKTSSLESLDKINIIGLHEKTELIWNILANMYAHGSCEITKCGYYKDGVSPPKEPIVNSEKGVSQIYLSPSTTQFALSEESTGSSVKTYITNTIDLIPKHVFLSTDFDQIGIIGVQKHLSSLSDFNNCAHSLFNFMRLSDVRHDINISEVILREANEVVFDMNVIRHADLPDQNQSASTGLYMEEACQLMKYLGASSHLSSLEITHVNFENSEDSKYYNTISTLLWYFIEGMSYRSPSTINKSDKKEYLVYPEGVENPIRFFNENLTNRWWCSLYESEEGLVACSPSDYENAKNGRFSDRMMKILELY